MPVKIKVKAVPYAEVLALPEEKRRRPRRPSLFFRTLLRLASAPTLRKVHLSAWSGSASTSRVWC